MDFQDFHAQLDYEPIEGYLHTGEYVSLPLVSHIVDNLYVGGHYKNVDLGDFFTHVFSLYHFDSVRPYKYADGVVFEGYTLYDSADALKGNQADGLTEYADRVVEALEAGGNVLVHCQAGINRSNLTAALALRKWKGLNAVEAIELLRSKRSNAVLANRSFENYLLGLDDFTTHELCQAEKVRLDRSRADALESVKNADDNF